MALTAYERQTVVNFNDDEPDAIITTYQRRVITKLRHNSGATEITTNGVKRLGGAEFRIPWALITFRNPRQKRDTDEETDD